MLRGLRVLRSNGDRYTIPLHGLPGADAELLDATGNILESYAPH